MFAVPGIGERHAWNYTPPPHADLQRHPAHRAQAPGNYIGAIRRYVEGQDEAGESIYCVVDLHAVTVAYDPAELRERVYDTIATLIAAGLDPERSVLFRQSDVLAHPELAWLLSSVTSWGDLNRMHQFKEKSGSQRELASAGLFSYPVLMAADVLAYRATHVPVGDDQRQHIELMRDIAERFNARYGETLVVPQGTYPTVARGSWTCRSRRGRCPPPPAASRAASTCSTRPRTSSASSSAR